MDHSEEAMKRLETAPPYPGVAVDQGAVGYYPAYPSPPYASANMAYTTYPEPGRPLPAGPSPVMYPPLPGPNPALSAAATVVVVAPQQLCLGELPAQTTCPHCHLQVISVTRHAPGLAAWLACGCLTLFGCWPCCLAPFWMESCQDVEHRCPNCQRVIWNYARL